METPWDDLIDYYRNKHCVTYVKKYGYDYVSLVKAYTEKMEALKFKEECEKEGTFIGYANMNEMPRGAIAKWIELQDGAKLPTTRLH